MADQGLHPLQSSNSGGQAGPGQVRDVTAVHLLLMGKCLTQGWLVVGTFTVRSATAVPCRQLRLFACTLVLAAASGPSA